MALASMNISLPEELKEYVEAQSQSALEELLLKGLDSGEPVRADKTFWADVKSKALKQIRIGK